MINIQGVWNVIQGTTKKISIKGMQGSLCSLGDPNYINFIHFKPQIKQNYKALLLTAKPMAYLNSLSNFLSENVNFHKNTAKNKKLCCILVSEHF